MLITSDLKAGYIKLARSLVISDLYIYHSVDNDMLSGKFSGKFELSRFKHKSLIKAIDMTCFYL